MKMKSLAYLCGLYDHIEEKISKKHVRRILELFLKDNDEWENFQHLLQRLRPLNCFYNNKNQVDEEVRPNPYGKCPECQSSLIDQISSEDGSTVEWYHCAKCGAWYNEVGEIDE